MRLGACSLLLLLAVATPRAQASVAIELTLEDLARQSDLVVVGTVGSSQAFWSQDHRRISTRLALQPEEVWKGSVPATGVVVFLPGGQLDGIEQAVSGVPGLSAGERVVLFLRRRGSGFHLVGMAQGMFRVPRPVDGSGPRAVRSLDGLQLVPGDPAHARGRSQPEAHSGDALSLPLDALHARVTAAIGAGPVR